MENLNAIQCLTNERINLVRGNAVQKHNIILRSINQQMSTFEACLVNAHTMHGHFRQCGLSGREPLLLLPLTMLYYARGQNEYAQPQMDKRKVHFRLITYFLIQGNADDAQIIFERYFLNTM